MEKKIKILIFFKRKSYDNKNRSYFLKKGDVAEILNEKDADGCTTLEIINFLINYSRSQKIIILLLKFALCQQVE